MSQHRGTLKVWKSDRGFGVIAPKSGSKDVFLDIHAIQELVREPKVGDTILYTPFLQSDGRIQAINASIWGVALQPRPRHIASKGQKSSKSQKAKPTLDPLFYIGGAVIGTALLAIAIVPMFKTNSIEQIISNASSTDTAAIAPANSDCLIKGNIAWNSGRKYYHLPGMADYEATQIDSERGERWFCTEAEARANGWTKAPTQ